MEKIDFQILKALLVNNGTPPGTPVLRKSFRSMAKDLGVDQGTIRSRIRKFQEQLVLRGWYLGASPGLTGQGVVYAWLMVDSESSKDSVIQKLLSQEDVERVCNYLGPKLSLILLYKIGADPNLALGRLVELIGSDKLLHKQAVIQVPSYELKESDARIIDVLRRDPWQPYLSVAKELGLSAKTVNRRVAKLTEGGAIYMLPIIDLKALQGIIPMELVVEYASRESRVIVNESITSHVRENLLFSDSKGPYGYFALAVQNVSQVERIHGWVKQLNGVKEARSEALQDVILNRSHYEHWRPSVRQRPMKEQVVRLGTETKAW